MTSHQSKKLDVDALKVFRDRFNLPIADDVIGRLGFYRPPEEGPEMTYLRAPIAEPTIRRSPTNWP
jgi:pyruvate dehydrogenase E1 component